MNATVSAPERSGSRQQAREMLSGLADDLSIGEVEIDFGDVFVATPSFMDEVIKVVLVERRARRLLIVRAPERTSLYAIRAAESREVTERLLTK